MAYDAFLKLDGIKGESMDAKHKGEIDIMSFSWGLTRRAHAVRAAAAARESAASTISHSSRRPTPPRPFFLNCANGSHIKEANLVVRKAGGDATGIPEDQTHRRAGLQLRTSGGKRRPPPRPLEPLPERPTREAFGETSGKAPTDPDGIGQPEL